MSTLRPLAGPAGLAVARARHPATRAGRPDVMPLARRLCDRLRAEGVAAPEVAAAVTATRGAWGVDRARFASLVGVRVEEVVALEGGRVRLSRVPSSLLVADPFAGVLAGLRRAA